MRSAPTMLHVRMPAGDSLLRGERVRVLHLIERVGRGWAESRITAICRFPGAEDFTAALRPGDSIEAELHNLRARENDLIGVIEHPPRLLPKAAQATRADTNPATSQREP